MAELCDIYNSSGNKTGEVFFRGETLKHGEFQLVTSIWVINNDLQILVQKRCEAKILAPNIWATHGGCVTSNENSLDACIREAHEEIGIAIKAKNIEPLTRIISEELIMDSYIVVQEFDISRAVLQLEEVSDIRWITLDELGDMVKNKRFFNYMELPYVTNFINNLRSIRGI